VLLRSRLGNSWSDQARGGTRQTAIRTASAVSRAPAGEEPCRTCVCKRVHRSTRPVSSAGVVEPAVGGSRSVLAARAVPSLLFIGSRRPGWAFPTPQWSVLRIVNLLGASEPQPHQHPCGRAVLRQCVRADGLGPTAGCRLQQLDGRFGGQPSSTVGRGDGVADLHCPLDRRAGEPSDTDHSGVGAVHEQVRCPLRRDAALQHRECAVQSAVERGPTWFHSQPSGPLEPGRVIPQELQLLCCGRNRVQSIAHLLGSTHAGPATTSGSRYARSGSDRQLSSAEVGRSAWPLRLRRRQECRMPGPTDDEGPMVTDDGASRPPYPRAARYLRPLPIGD
jgi:hypothetical protein